jgi:hypothetical protein
VETHAQDVDRRLHQVGRDVGDQQRHARVGREHLPRPVDDHRRERRVRVQDALNRFAHGLHLRVVERVLAVPRRVAGGEQQLVALAQRHLQVLGQLQHHLGRRPRPAGLDERDVTRGNAGLQGEVEL